MGTSNGGVIMIATTIGQARKLIELGLPVDSADMEYCYIDEFNSGLQVKGDINAEVDRRLDMMFGVTHIPAWSLSALLEVMPKELEVGLFKTPISGEYFFSWWTNDHHMGDDYKEPIDAAYEMVCWLLTNNLITNN